MTLDFQITRLDDLTLDTTSPWHRERAASDPEPMIRARKVHTDLPKPTLTWPDTSAPKSSDTAPAPAPAVPRAVHPTTEVPVYEEETPMCDY